MAVHRDPRERDEQQPNSLRTSMVDRAGALGPNVGSDPQLSPFLILSPWASYLGSLSLIGNRESWVITVIPTPLGLV